VYPRWSAYLNFFVAVFMIEAALVLFFKTGPFSLNGFFVFYVPMFVFFTWIMLFSVLAYRGADILAARRQGVSALSGLSDNPSAIAVPEQPASIVSG